jgi:hypothetical protein
MWGLDAFQNGLPPRHNQRDILNRLSYWTSSLIGGLGQGYNVWSDSLSACFTLGYNLFSSLVMAPVLSHSLSGSGEERGGRGVILNPKAIRLSTIHLVAAEKNGDLTPNFSVPRTIYQGCVRFIQVHLFLKLRNILRAGALFSCKCMANIFRFLGCFLSNPF